MYVVKVNNEVVYATNNESTYRHVVAKKYANVSNAKLDYVKPVAASNSIKLQQEK